MKYFLPILLLAYAITFSSANIENLLKELDTLVQLQHAENENLKTRVTELEDEITDILGLDSDTEQQEGTYTQGHLSDAVAILSKHVFKRASGSTVAFHAYLSGSVCHHDRETIIFDAKEGGVDDFDVYDQMTGVFDPPTSGVYVFTWTISALPQTKFVTELMVDGNVTGVMTTDSDTGTGSGTHPATAVVVAQATAGLHSFIRVRIRDNDGCITVLSDSNQVRTTFTAWKLFSH